MFLRWQCGSIQDGWIEPQVNSTPVGMACQGKSDLVAKMFSLLGLVVVGAFSLGGLMPLGDQRRPKGNGPSMIRRAVYRGEHRSSIQSDCRWVGGGLVLRGWRYGVGG